MSTQLGAFAQSQLGAFAESQLKARGAEDGAVPVAYEIYLSGQPVVAGESVARYELGTQSWTPIPGTLIDTEGEDVVWFDFHLWQGNSRFNGFYWEQVFGATSRAHGLVHQGEYLIISSTEVVRYDSGSNSFVATFPWGGALPDAGGANFAIGRWLGSDGLELKAVGRTQTPHNGGVPGGGAGVMMWRYNIGPGDWEFDYWLGPPPVPDLNDRLEGSGASFVKLNGDWIVAGFRLRDPAIIDPIRSSITKWNGGAAAEDFVQIDTTRFPGPVGEPGGRDVWQFTPSDNDGAGDQSQVVPWNGNAYMSGYQWNGTIFTSGVLAVDGSSVGLTISFGTDAQGAILKYGEKTARAFAALQTSVLIAGNYRNPTYGTGLGAATMYGAGLWNGTDMVPMQGLWKEGRILTGAPGDLFRVTVAGQFEEVSWNVLGAAATALDLVAALIASVQPEIAAISWFRHAEDDQSVVGEGAINVNFVPALTVTGAGSVDDFTDAEYPRMKPRRALAHEVPVSLPRPVITSGTETRVINIAVPYNEQLTGDDVTFWELVDPPAGMTISATGLVNWPAPTRFFSDVSVYAANGRSWDTLEYRIDGQQFPPTIDPVPDDTADVGAGFYTVRVTLDTGDTPVTWSLIDGPVSGTVVLDQNASGSRVDVEWSGYSAETVNWRVRATNTVGFADETWQTVAS